LALSGTPVTDANIPPSFTLLTNCSAVLPRTVCHDIDRRKSDDGGLIVESHHLISADASSCVQLFLSNAGNHDRSLVSCRAHGRAANAADGARNQKRLARLDATRHRDELASRDRDERECGCLDQVDAIGDSRKNAGFNST
jgi:hypothetical protein